MMMTYTFDDPTVSDLYEEAYGFRPSADWRFQWSEMRDEDKQEEWDWLIGQAEQEVDREKSRQREALREFEGRVERAIQDGAYDREQAIRWILQAEGLEDEQDAGYICYCLGLSYDCEGIFTPFCGG
jgi:hypothetical protein